MGLPWPSIQNVGGDLDEATQRKARSMLDRLGDRVQAVGAARGLARAASPLFRSWNLLVLCDAEKVICVFGSPAGGMATLRYLDRSSQLVDAQALASEVAEQLGWQIQLVVSLPLAALEGEGSEVLDSVAAGHVSDIERDIRFSRLKSTSGIQHLEPYLLTFLDDHPDPERSVFLMMRFRNSDQMRDIHETLTTSLGERGLQGIRADDRDYTGELWTNIEVCMAGSNLGIAVFEDIDERDFNPNVSLEVGYMLGRGKRCLILKEQRLPNLPTDLMHRLYKPFDAFDIASTVRAQVLRWVDVDLGLGA